MWSCRRANVTCTTTQTARLDMIVTRPIGSPCRAHQAYSSGDMPARTIVQIATDIEQVNARIVRLEADIQAQRVKIARLVK